MWFETVNIKIRHLIYLLFLPQHWGLSRHVLTHPALSLWACNGSWHCRKTKLLPSQWVRSLSCALNIQTEQQEEAVPPMETFLILFVRPLPPCTSSTSAKYMCLSQERQRSIWRPQAKRWFGVNPYRMDLLVATLLSPPKLLFQYLLFEFLPCPLNFAANALSINIRKLFPSIVLGVFYLWLDMAE